MRWVKSTPEFLNKPAISTGEEMLPMTSFMISSDKRKGASEMRESGSVRASPCDFLPESEHPAQDERNCMPAIISRVKSKRSEEHTSELQSRPHLVCRLLLEK